MLKYPFIRKLVQTKYIDILGALLIFGVCYARNFHGTIYVDGEIVFGIPFEDLWSKVKMGAYPLGIMSTVGAVFSVLATRLIGKQNNTGNGVSVVTTVNSGTNDFLFGNASAIITYPLSFFLHSLALFKWKAGERMKKRDNYYYLAFVLGFIISFALVYLGAYLFGGKTDNNFLIVVGITFGLSLGGNFSTAMKYEETGFNWILYNIVQLVKNTMILNVANVVKYLFYLVNASFTLVDWKFNGDIKDAPLAEA